MSEDAMEDRQLLELAAKAAGIGLWWDYIDGMDVCSKDGGGDWNPLTNDGDALRLAIKLGIDLRFDDIEQTTEARHPRTTYGEHAEYGLDRYAATRRAVVRAAAEIGRTK